MAPRNPYEFTRTEYNELVKKIPHPVYSKRSEYEEIELVEDCTLYDIYRQPREPVTDPSVTKSLPVRVLNADLTCPICLGIIRSTEVVMECLHRFCGECIHRSLRLGKNECPSCRMHIPSKRSLRRDANFDELISKIYPDLEEFTIQEERLVAEINRERHFNNILTESTRLGVAHQQSARRNASKKKQATDPEASPSSSSDSSASPNGESRHKRTASWSAASASAAASNGNGTTTDENSGQRKKQRTTASPTSSASGSTNGSSAAASAKPAAASPSAATATRVKEEDATKVNVRVLLHPDEDQVSAPRLARALFRTSPNLKMSHLKKHLVTLLKIESMDNLRIVLPATNRELSGLGDVEKRAAEKAAKGEQTGIVARKDLKYDQELEDYVMLRDIYQQYGMGTQWELQLYYHFSDTIVNGVARFIANGV